MEVFGSHLKKSKKQSLDGSVHKTEELQIVYTCGNYLKLLSFKTQSSMIIYKNLIELTAMCIVQQNPNIVAFGTISGAIKEFDMKSKQVVRRTAK